MAKIQFFLYDMTYRAKKGESTVYLFGRSSKGKRVVVLDRSFKPYFLVKEDDKVGRDKLIKKIKDVKEDDGEVLEVDTVKKKIEQEEKELLKVYVSTPKNVPKIARVVRDLKGVEGIFEFDIPFVKKYLIDKSIMPLTLVEAEGKQVNSTAKADTFHADKIEQGEEATMKSPRTLAFDIETYNPEGKVMRPEKNPIIMISFYGNGIEKVITWKRFKTKKDYIEFVEGEEELIQRFKEVVNAYKPEFITGYFSDGFDFPYIAKRADKYKIDLNIGLDSSNLVISNRSRAKARIKGIVHIDIFHFIRKVISRTMETERYDLDSVAEELLGKKKEGVDLNKLAGVWDKGGKDIEQYCYYNLVDSVLAYDLARKVMPNILELSKIVRILPFEGTRKGFSQLVESYLMHQTKEFNQIIPRRPKGSWIKERRAKKYQGAYVYKPDAGVYEDIVVLDFRSLYPSIISSHNISAETLNCDDCKNVEKVPGLDDDYWFCEKKKGFIPQVIDNLISRRMRVKQMIKQKEQKDAVLLARSDTLKLLANSLYGYYGFFGSRWYCWECAESITAFARNYIKDLIDTAEEEGFKVIYGDTDSVFILLGDKKIEDVKKFTAEVNKDLPGIMELEYEAHYKRGIFVSTKSGAGGAKKKYAMISEKGKIKITGFETVRRNWSLIAKETQKKVINILLKDNDVKKALMYIRKIMKDLKKHKVEVDKLLIRTQLKKDVDDYVQIGPHVAVAKRMKERGDFVGPGLTIEYVISEKGDKIRDKARVPAEMGKNDKYDADYYIDNQVLPAVESIMEVYGYSLDKIKKGHGQSGLNDFF